MTNPMTTKELRELAAMIEDRTLGSNDLLNRAADAILALTARVDACEQDEEYMDWIANNAEIVTTGEGMKIVIDLSVFGNNNWSIRDYLSMEIGGRLHSAALNAKDVTP